MTATVPSFALPALAAFYADGGSPADVVRAAYRRILASEGNPVWISLVAEPAALLRAERLAGDAASRKLPLFGVPFAVKDNIDAAGTDTTAACPAFAYRPRESAACVQRLVDAGAILIGKTNLDQFATGLVGTRSPYGEVRNAFNAAYISGGSSSGSAVAVALGQVAFSLGTDTAGSGRVPAGFNNIVGLKPTRGRVSTRGVVPACRTLDCVSVFAGTSSEALRILEIIEGADPADPYSRRILERSLRSQPVLGVPRGDQLEWFGDAESPALFAQAIERLERLGARIVSIDFAPFREAGELLYGPWVAERHAGLQDFLGAHPDAVLPVTRGIIEAARDFSATDVFRAQYRLSEIAARTAPIWEHIDALALPTAPTLFTREQVEHQPVQRNAELGVYTTFVNLLDLAAVAVPSALRANGLPFGITLAAPAGSDRALCSLGERFHALTGMKAGATEFPLQFAAPAVHADAPGRMQVAVVGAHLSGQPLNHQLTAGGGRLLRACRTAPRYRLFALPGGPPARPGLVREEDRGAVIELEVWELGALEFASLVASIAAPLGIGTLELEDGTQVQGFLCETYATRRAEDITSFGGWRAYLARGSLATPR